MDEQMLKKELKTKTKQQLLEFAQQYNIVVGAELSVKKMRTFIYEAMTKRNPHIPEDLAKAVDKAAANDIANAEADTVSGGEPMTDEQRAAADAAAAEADEAEETEADKNQWSMLQKYLNGSLTSVQVQFLDRIANDIQEIKTAVPPTTVEKLEATIKEWINGLEDLV